MAKIAETSQLHVENAGSNKGQLISLLKDFSACFSWLAQAAITKYHRLSDLNNINLSQFWRLQVQDQRARRVGF